MAKHFAHKITVRQDGDRAEFDFAFGTAQLEAADEMLVASIEAPDDEELVRARRVIDDHLRRFAFREEFQHMEWTKPHAA